MRKLTRKSLSELAMMLPVVENEIQASYVGGGDGTLFDPYTMAEYSQLVANGNWNGGYVVGQGFVGSNLGTEENPYTWEQYDALVANGLWEGGYVEGHYMNSNVGCYIYGSSQYPGIVAQWFASFPDYIESLSLSGFDQLTGTILNGIPIIGPICDYIMQEIGDMHREIQAELLRMGYNGDSYFNVVTTISRGSHSEYSMKTSVFNTETGNLIIEKKMSLLGFY